MLFDNYSNFYTYANNYKKVSYLSIPETSFEIISEHKQLLELKCKKCGAGFIEHYEFLKYGFGCINCNKTFTPTEFVQNQLNMVTHNEYKLLSPFQGYYSKHILFHNICGKPTKISLSERLFENRECSCKLSSTIDSIQDIINEKTDEFEVINTFKQKGNKFITIKHRKCKNVFSIKTSNFYRTPKCKYCK